MALAIGQDHLVRNSGRQCKQPDVEAGKLPQKEEKKKQAKLKTFMGIGID